MDGSRYVAAYLIILLAQREENIVPPFSRRNPLVNLSGAFIVMASTMVPCRSVLLAQREESIVPPFSRRNPVINLLGEFVVYGKHHGALPKCLAKKIKKALSAFFIFCRNLCV